ncbi:MAG: NAD-binding protein [Epsilonproteobacteria bacterium]|nr:NAD-binding protein [Campylobacterota bacterium]
MDIKASLVKFSYTIASSKKYQEFKAEVKEILEDTNSPKKRYFDLFMIVLVLATILILIFEIKHNLPPWIYAIEGSAIAIFIVEWLGRLWVNSDVHQMVIESYENAESKNRALPLGKLLKEVSVKKLKFIFSPMSIIDLLAILPSYRPLRFLRFFLLFRLFKIFRYTQNMNFLMKVFVEKKFEFFTLFILFSFLVFFASTVIYVFEGTGANDNINSFYDAIYWAVVTITTVGYGDISPQTGEGRFATILLIVSGLGIIAFTTSIVTTAMTEKLAQVKENNILSQVSKLQNFVVICGYGKMGKVFAEELFNSGEQFVIVDIDEQAVIRASEKDYLALNADASDLSVLESLNISENAKYVLAMTNDDALNLSIILSIRSINPNIDVIARANHVSSRKKFLIAGAKRVIFPYETAAIATIEYLEQPLAYNALEIISQDNVGPVTDEIEIFLDDPQSHREITQVTLKKYGLKLVGIVKKGDGEVFEFNPKSDPLFVEDLDILIVIGYSDDIASFKTALIKGK